jgi:hypothetical protein
VWNEGDLPGVEGDYGLAFHDADYLRSHWSGWFSIVGVVERGLTDWQDVVVCRALR